MRLGAPQDLVASGLGPILKGFSLDHPRVELTLVCATSTELLKTLKRGRSTSRWSRRYRGARRMRLWTAPRYGSGQEGHRFSQEPAAGFHGRRSVRVPADGARCAAQCGRPWRTVFESGSIDATAATVRADLAVTASPCFYRAVGVRHPAPECGLPELPAFAIHLHVAGVPASPAALALGRLIRGTSPGPDVARILHDGTAKAGESGWCHRPGSGCGGQPVSPAHLQVSSARPAALPFPPAALAMSMAAPANCSTSRKCVNAVRHSPVLSGDSGRPRRLREHTPAAGRRGRPQALDKASSGPRLAARIGHSSWRRAVATDCAGTRSRHR